ncbi:MAG: D-alanyl-D-alanine carboxypeptidase/D-alanyl-D-alanine-endopeptidase, partial [Alphaproteobacteria bacterium]
MLALLGAGAGAAMFGPGPAAALTRSLVPPARPLDIRRAAAGPIEAVLDRLAPPGVTAFAAADAESGRPIERHAPLRRLPPASVLKVITTLYALEHLGPDHRFATRLIATGPVRAGRLEGDLILAGGGDPTLDTDRLAELAAALKAAGVRELAGRFAVWSGALPYTPWISADQPYELAYNPAVSGLMLNFNRVYFEWKRMGKGYDLALQARSRAHRPRVSCVRIALAERATPTYRYAADAEHERWTVRRSALGRKGGRWLPVRRPARYAAEVFATLARSHGIVLPPAVELTRPPEGEVIAETLSAPLSEMLRSMLRYSTNLTAEAVGLAATIAAGGRPERLRDSAAAMARWAARRWGLRGLRLVDHSGLGDASRVRPQDMVSVLLAERGRLAPLLKEMPLRDRSGRREAWPRIRAKTGTLNFVSNLAGYAERA